MQGLIPKCLAAINRGLAAKKKTTEDVPAQMQAVRRARDLLLLAQGKPPEAEPGDDRAQVTWEEFDLVYRRGTVEA